MNARVRIGSVLTACGIAALAGCATNRAAPPPPKPTREGAKSTDLPAVAELVRASEDQQRHPVAAARALPAPPGISPELFASLAAERDPRAAESLESVMAQFAAPKEQMGAAPAAPSPPDEDQVENATRSYISGREKLLTGDAPGAVKEFKAALQADPTSGEAWRELGEAQLVAGARTEAVDSLEHAERLGIKNARLLELLGRTAADRGDHERAAAYFARALDAAPEATDPLLPLVLDYSLAHSLSELGYLNASKELLLRLVTREPSLTSTSRYMQEFGAIYRRQGDLWREVGDVEMRLQRPAAALAAYQEAVLIPPLDGQSSMPRLVYAAMQAGRPAAAGVEVLSRIIGAGGRPTAEDLDLLRHISRIDSTRRQIAASLAQYRRDLGAAPPTLDAGLTRAQAAVSPPHEAARLLTEHLSRQPGDAEAAAALLGLSSDAAGIADAALAAASAQPMACPALAEGVLRAGQDPETVVLALLRPGPSHGAGALLASWVELKRGYMARALELAELAPATGPLASAAALAQAEIALNAGRPSQADTALLHVTGTNHTSMRIRAVILAMLQRDRAALETLTPLLDGPATDPGERIECLLLASRLGALLGRGEDAEQWLKSAAALDPGDDRALGFLMDLYSPAGPRPDSGKLAQTVRELRQNHADGRVLRMARVRELVRRSLLAQAEKEAQQLAAESPDDRLPIEALTNIWEQQAKNGVGAGKNSKGVDSGLAWLDGPMARRPLEPVLTAARVTLLVSAARNDEAEELLRHGIKDGGGADLSRVLERLLRDHLDRAKEANTLALARLEGRPRTLAESIELAEVYARLERGPDAAGTLRAALNDDVTLLPEQSSHVLLIGATVSQQSLRLYDRGKPNAEMQRAGLDLLDLAVACEIKLPRELHEQRLQLLALSPSATPESLAGAFDLAARQSPELGLAPHLQIATLLAQNKRCDLARGVLVDAAARQGRTPAEIARFWFLPLALCGSAEDARTLIRALEKSGKLQQIVEDIRAGMPPEGDVVDYRAQAGYFFGVFCTEAHRDEQANAAYELALEYQPTHAWAANNLGYYLADHNTDMPRAEKLLEAAHESLPQEPAILDSLGWLRYKQGIIEDTGGGNATAVVPGAITLLQSATRSARGQADATILNHLADALWLAGRLVEAQRAWTLAESVATQTIQSNAAVRARLKQSRTDQQLPDPSADDASQDAELHSLASDCAKKRSAAATGGVVHVAPQFANSDPQPKPAPAPVPAPTAAADEPVGPPVENPANNPGHP